MKLQLSFTARALDDLIRLRAFIARDNPQAARRVSQVLRASIHHLVDHPQMGVALNAPAGVRRWVAGPYVMHYMIDGLILRVLRIWHGREERVEV